MIQYLKVQGCALSTIKTYRDILRLIERYHPEFENYNSQKLIEVMNAIPDPITRSNYRNVILKVHRDMLGKHLNIPFIKKPERLQKVYTHEEVKKIFATITNKKHEAMARLLYVEGMRVGEIVSILVTDCNKGDKSIFIRGTKNKKDYKKYLDDSTIKCLSEYCLWLKERRIPLRKYLFEGNEFNQYSKRSIQEIMTSAIAKSGLDKRGSCHVFRRSNATWKIESGWSLKHIAASLNNTEKTVSKYYALVRPDYIKSLPKPML
jgi:integrase/recombinase XerD